MHLCMGSMVCAGGVGGHGLMTACTCRPFSYLATMNILYLLQGLHERLDPLLLFFIDGACLIDNNDLKWELLLAVQEGEAGGHTVVRVGERGGEGGCCWQCRSPRRGRKGRKEGILFLEGRQEGWEGRVGRRGQ